MKQKTPPPQPKSKTKPIDLKTPQPEDSPPTTLPTNKPKTGLIITLIVLLLAALGIVGYLAYKNYQLKISSTLSTSPTQTPTSTQPTLKPATSSPTTPETDTTIPNWETYTEPNFSIQYPSDVELSFQEDTIYLSKWGPTQKPETEFYDGISLSFTIKQLSNQTLEQYTDTQIQQEKDMGFMEIFEEKQPYQMNDYSGFTYTTTGLGTHQYILLQNPNLDQFVEITNSTSDPTNQGFDSIVDQILSTFAFAQ